MHTGMLWLDLSTNPLSIKVQKAADYYQKKYGRRPELCLVHPSTIGDMKITDVDGVTVRSWRYVLPGHLWIGVESMPEPAPANAEEARAELEKGAA